MATKRVGNYRLGRTLGKGAFGRVKVGTNVVTNQTVAVKILNREDILDGNMTEQVRNEITVLRRVRHHNICNLVDVMATRERIYIVIEFISGGELLYHLGKFSEAVAHSYYRQLIEGVQYCHSVGVCHRDIKLENLLVTDDGHLKITDFGLAIGVEEGKKLYHISGTPAFMAPEIPLGKGDMKVMRRGALPFIDRTAAVPGGRLRTLTNQGATTASTFSNCAGDIPARQKTQHPNAPNSLTNAFSMEGLPITQLPTPLNAFELLAHLDMFSMDPLLATSPTHLTRFLTVEPVELVVKRITQVLCTMPVSFSYVESCYKFKISAPFANGMIIVFAQLHLTTNGGLILVDFQKWRGDGDEFLRLYLTAAGTDAMAESFTYTIIQQDDDKDQPSVQDLRNQLETGKDEQKIEAMKKILLLMLNGDPLPQLLMHVIRFVLPHKNKTLKKLLLVYWEICPKTNPDGKLKQEMVLVCNAIRNDLLHPNEYIRGATLRFLCKLREAEILEPLIPSVRQCLEHRHAYVRKNALLAIYNIYKTFDYLIPDAPEFVHTYLLNEADTSCKRNAFIMLMNTKQALAVEYLNSVFGQVGAFDELLQLSIIELIRKECRTPTAEKAKYIQCILSLLHAASPSVKYEAANTLTNLTSHPSAIKGGASAYLELILKVADNNVKLIVLDKVNELRDKHDRILDDKVMDILRVLSSPDIEVRRKCLKISMEMVSSRNVDEVVNFLKKELVRTHEAEYEKNNEYKQLLIHAIHSCAIKFSEVAANVVHVLMEFLGDSNNASAVDVIAFVREVMEKFPQLRGGIVGRLLQTFADMKTGRVFRGALWIIGEYALDAAAIEEAFRKIRSALGEIPILASEQQSSEEPKKEDEPKVEAAPGKPTPARRVLADGTYATESAFSQKSPTSATADSALTAHKPPLRALILNGDYFVGSVLASCLTKLVLRYGELQEDRAQVNTLRSEAMLIMTSIIRVGKSEVPSSPIDEDSHDRIMTCLRVLSSVPDETVLKEVFLTECRRAFTELIKAEEKTQKRKLKQKETVKVHADDVLSFRQLRSKKTLGSGADEYELDLTRATGQGERTDDLVSKLNRVIQLTGYSDPVYAEAYVNVHQYDILLDVLIVNQTNDTLQNLTLEFSTLGDLKLVERPTPHTLGPRGFHSIKANIKVSSTETGVIFGNIVYDGPSALDMNCVILNDIHIDIMDYINPATCTETQFRMMWSEFEWENKVNVNTNVNDLRVFLSHILKSTNMNCLTPDHALSGECGFLAANMYARSIFGEDALANICLESQGGSITGHIRIRSKTQGIALSLGDKITLSQKNVVVAAA
ncbi:coatomer subunit beta [Rhizophlyctis rosea]|nr:coatomer subunit beta [Rhizophlyctis rosea]